MPIAGAAIYIYTKINSQREKDLERIGAIYERTLTIMQQTHKEAINVIMEEKND